MPAINSIQTGTTTMVAGLAAIDVTISSVDMSKSIIKVDLSTDTDITANNFAIAARIDSATEIHFERYGNTNALFIHWQVIEFVSGSVQRGFQSTGVNRFTNVTISSVDTDHAFNNLTARTFGTDFLDWTYTNALTSSTNLQFGLSRQYSFTFFDWEVISGLDDCEIFHGFGTTPAAQTVDLILPTPVNSVSNTFTQASFSHCNTNDEMRSYSLVDASTLRTFAYWGVANEYSIQIVECPDINVQRGDIISTAASATATLSPAVDWNESVIFLNCQNGYSTPVNVGYTTGSLESCFRSDDLSSTSVGFYRGTASNQFLLNWEVITFGVEPEPEEIRHYVLII